MSILFFEGFETVGTELGLSNEAITRPRIALRWDDTNSGGVPATDSFFVIDDYINEGFAIQMTENSFGSSNYLEFQIPNNGMRVPAGASAPIVVVGGRYHSPVTARSGLLLQIEGQFSAGSDQRQMSFNIVDSTDISINLGTSGAFHTTVNLLTPGAWHYIEFRFKNAELADGGLIQVWVDNVLKIDLDPVDANDNMTVVATSAIRFQGVTGSTTTNDWVGWDDIYILWEGATPHQQRLGSTRVRSLPPISDVVGDFNNDTKLALGVTLNGATETIINVGTGNIPSGTPSTGDVRVELDSGPLRTVTYISHNGDDEFTTASTDWTAGNVATVGNDVFITFDPNFDKINENGADENNYVETDIDETRDRYNLTNLVELYGILSVKVEAEARNETGGDPDLVIELKSGSTIGSTIVTVTDTVNYDLFQVYYEEDPDTGAEWTNSSIDAMTAGFSFDNKIS